MGLHFQQTAEGALEFELQAAAGIEVLEFHLGGEDQLDVTVVELVDHVDEATRHVVLGHVHLFDVGNEHRIVDLAQLDVVVLAAGTVAQRAEVEPGHVVGYLAGDDLAVLDDQRLVLQHRAVFRQQAAEALLQAQLGLGVQREMIELRLLQGAQPVIDAAVDVDDLGVLLQQLDRRQEARTLQAVLVKPVGDDVGGGHQAHAVLEQFFE